MKMSILNERCVAPNKGGSPVFIDAEMEFDNLSDIIPYLQRHHIAISVFEPAYRCGKNWKSSDILTADFDNGETSDIIHAQLVLLGLTHLIIASKNHLKDKGDGDGVRERFHLFIPLSETITGDPNLYSHLASCFVKDRKWKVDMGVTKDKCRYYYKHKDALFYYEGKPLDVAPYKETANIIRRIYETAPHTSPRTVPLFKRNPIYLKYSKYWKGIQNDLNTVGMRHDTARKAFWYCIVNKISKSDAVSLVVEAMGQHGIDTKEDLERLYDWMAERTTV